MPHTPHTINEAEPLARAKRALEMLDYIFPGYATQAAATEALQDLMHLEDAEPEKLHLIGALEDARNGHEATAYPAGSPAPAGPGSGIAAAGAGETAQANPPAGQVINLEERRFARGHSDEPTPA